MLNPLKRILPRRRPRLAMVMTVRDEETFLAANLLYHRALGVERAYVFLDRSTDASQSIAAALPWVTPLRVNPRDAERFAYIAHFHCAAFDYAKQLARREGFDWLLALDADEFAFADNPPGNQCGEKSILARGDLRTMLRRVAKSTDVVRLRTKEVVPLDLGEAAPFWRQTFFQDRQKIQRELLDPVEGRVATWRGFFGHDEGKSIVRTSAPVQAFDSHRWVRSQGKQYPQSPAFAAANVEETGFHQHFLIVNQRQWYEKYCKCVFEPDRWDCGVPVELPRQSWKRAVSSLSYEQLANYFGRWIAMREEDARQLAGENLLTEENLVEQVLRAVGVLADGQLSLPASRRARRIRDWSLPSIDSPDKPKGVVRRRDGQIDYVLGDMRYDWLRGFQRPEDCGDGIFRWSESKAAVRVGFPPGDYQMTLHMNQFRGMWRGSLAIAINGQRLPARERIESETGVTIQLRKEDFPAAGKHWLEFEFEPIDTSAWPTNDPRSLGAAIFEISFTPVARARKAA